MGDRWGAAFVRIGWQASFGLGGSFAPDWVAGITGIRTPPPSEPLTDTQSYFLDCGKALTRALAKEFEEAVARGEVPTGPCWVCGKLATERCDYGYDESCCRWLCHDHAIIEAQHWDIHGMDGVDIRCAEHRN